MKKFTIAVLLLAMGLLFCSPMTSYARGFRGGWGWWPWAVGGAMVGATLAAPYYNPYYSPYYYPPRPVVVQAPPPVYVQPQQEAYYWYYCQEGQGYYPYVQSCPGGWMKVVPNANPPSPEGGMVK